MGDQGAEEVGEPATETPEQLQPNPPEIIKSEFLTPDGILKISLAVAALFVGLGIFYYFIFYVPARDRAVQARESEAAAQQFAEQERRVAAKRADQQSRQAAYRDCVFKAEETYTREWESKCFELSATRNSNYEKCMQGEYNENCMTYYPPVSETDCKLPRAIAETYETRMNETKSRCLEASKAGLQAPAIY